MKFWIAFFLLKKIEFRGLARWLSPINPASRICQHPPWHYTGRYPLIPFLSFGIKQSSSEATDICLDFHYIWVVQFGLEVGIQPHFQQRIGKPTFQPEEVAPTHLFLNEHVLIWLRDSCSLPSLELSLVQSCLLYVCCHVLRRQVIKILSNFTYGIKTRKQILQENLMNIDAKLLNKILANESKNILRR